MQSQWFQHELSSSLPPSNFQSSVSKTNFFTLRTMVWFRYPVEMLTKGEHSPRVNCGYYEPVIVITYFVISDKNNPDFKEEA